MVIFGRWEIFRTPLPTRARERDHISGSLETIAICVDPRRPIGDIWGRPTAGGLPRKGACTFGFGPSRGTGGTRSGIPAAFASRRIEAGQLCHHATWLLAVLHKHKRYFLGKILRVAVNVKPNIFTKKCKKS
jgi:hypothetical protein